MKETEQTLLDQIKDQVAQELFKCQFGNLLYSEHEKAFINKICELYATAKAKASCEATLKKASDNAKIKADVDPIYEGGDILYFIDKDSITDPNNITIV